MADSRPRILDKPPRARFHIACKISYQPDFPTRTSSSAWLAAPPTECDNIAKKCSFAQDAQIQETGGEAISVAADVSKAGDVDAMVRRTVETYGRLDRAFNNAGIEGQVTPTTECTEDNRLRVIAINLTGLCMKYEIAQTLKQGGGSIVNTSSAAGLVAVPGGPAYGAAKHGIAALTKTAAVRYTKSGTRVNAVCPGFIRTPMIERLLDKGVYAETDAIEWYLWGAWAAREIAEAVAWLCFRRRVVRYRTPDARRRWRRREVAAHVIWPSCKIVELAVMT